MLGHKYKVLTMWPRGPASLGQVLRWPNLVGHETKVAHEAGPQIQGFDQAAQWPSICWLSYAVHQFIQRLCKHCFTVTLVVICVPISIINFRPLTINRCVMISRVEQYRICYGNNVGVTHEKVHL